MALKWLRSNPRGLRRQALIIYGVRRVASLLCEALRRRVWPLAGWRVSSDAMNWQDLKSSMEPRTGPGRPSVPTADPSWRYWEAAAMAFGRPGPALERREAPDPARMQYMAVGAGNYPGAWRGLRAITWRGLRRVTWGMNWSLLERLP